MEKEQKKQKTEGLIAATFAPFTSDGKINFSVLPAYVDFLKQQGVSGIFINGSTGEGPSLSIGERKELAEAFLEAAKGHLYTFVHVGHESLKEAAGLAQHAAKIGADAIAAAPPTYFKPRTIMALIQSLTEIVNAAPEVPFYYYHIPIKTGVNLDMYAFLEQANRHLPSLKGLKFTDYGLDTLQRCLSIPDYSIFYGRDELFLSAIAIGVKGFIGSTYNFMGNIYHEIQTAFQAGNIGLAQEKQLFVSNLVSVINQYHGLPPQKIMVRLKGMDCGSVRAPLTPLSSAEEATMVSALTKIGFINR